MYSFRLERPNQQNQRYGQQYNHDFKWQAHAPVISEGVSARAQHQGIGLMPDWGQKAQDAPTATAMKNGSGLTPSPKEIP